MTSANAPEPQEPTASEPDMAAQPAVATEVTATGARAEEEAAVEAAVCVGVERGESEALSNPDLIGQLTADRLWLLRQIDGGRWPDLRLDLAALERELGQMLDLASERLTKP